MNPDNTSLFKPEDLNQIEALTYKPSLAPKYNAMRMYLQWDDELPANITPDAYLTLCDLWIARAVIHHGLKLHESLDAEHYKSVWSKALKQSLRWPGFERLTLSSEDQNYFEKSQAQLDHFE
jgi:hypothetical protein